MQLKDLEISMAIEDLVTSYLLMDSWSPVLGALLVNGITPPSSCDDIPSAGLRLDGVVLSQGSENIVAARRLYNDWVDWVNDHAENGIVLPVDISPTDFLLWCEEEKVSNYWYALIRYISGSPLDSYREALPLPEVVLANPRSLLHGVASREEPRPIGNAIVFPSQPLTGLQDVSNEKTPPSLTTKEIAHLFDGINKWDARKWTKYLSATAWLKEAQIKKGAPGKGGSSTWNPFLLAVIVNEKRRATRFELGKLFVQPKLEPWRSDWQNYDADQRYSKSRK